MQVLKPEIQQSLLAKGKKSFFEQGYAATSTRELSRQAGISASNFYRYFEGKEALFEAVMGDYARAFQAAFEAFLAHREAEPHPTDDLVKILTGLIQKDRIRFLILLEHSHGTPYARMRCHMLDQIVTRVRLMVSGALPGQAAVVAVIAENFLDGVLALARQVRNADRLACEIDALVRYHMGGVQALVGS